MNLHIKINENLTQIMIFTLMNNYYLITTGLSYSENQNPNTNCGMNKTAIVYLLQLSLNIGKIGAQLYYH